MRLFAIGLSHRTAPVELRERLDFQARGVERALRSISARHANSEAVIVSTCNRAEVYAACEDVAAGRQAIADFISEYHGVDRSSVMPHVYDLTDLDAARHLERERHGQ